ncbi:hypothetical protein ACFLQ2_00095 [archaeon]
MNIMRRLLLLLLILSLAACDGFKLPTEVAGDVVETSQLAVITPSGDTAEYQMFLALERYSGEEPEPRAYGEAEVEEMASGEPIAWVLALREKASYMESDEATLPDFKDATGISLVEDAIKADKKYMEQSDDHLGNLMLAAGLTYMMPFGAAAPLGLYFWVGGLATRQPTASGPIEEYEVARGHVEVYNVTESNMGALFDKYGLSESVKQQFMDYGQMYLYVFTLQPFEREGKEVYDLLKEGCDDPDGAMELLQKDLITEREWDALGCTIPLSSHDWHRRWEYEGLSVESLRERLENTEGISLKFDQAAGEDGFWYPLGTGQFWEKPIAMTGVYVFPPEGTAVDGMQRVRIEDGDAFMAEYIGSNPSEDLLVKVTPKGIGAQAADIVRPATAFLLDTVPYLVWVVPLASCIFGAWALLVFWQKKEKMVALKAAAGMWLGLDASGLAMGFVVAVILFAAVWTSYEVGAIGMVAAPVIALIGIVASVAVSIAASEHLFYSALGEKQGIIEILKKHEIKWLYWKVLIGSLMISLMLSTLFYVKLIVLMSLYYAL